MLRVHLLQQHLNRPTRTLTHLSSPFKCNSTQSSSLRLQTPQSYPYQPHRHHRTQPPKPLQPRPITPPTQPTYSTNPDGSLDVYLPPSSNTPRMSEEERASFIRANAIDFFPIVPVRGIATYLERLLHWYDPKRFSLNGRVIPTFLQRTRFVALETVLFGFSTFTISLLTHLLKPILSTMSVNSALLVNSALVTTGIIIYLVGTRLVVKYLPSCSIVSNPHLISLNPIERFRRRLIRFGIGAGILLATGYYIWQNAKKENPMGTPFVLENPRLLEYSLDCTNSGWSLPWAAAPVTITGPIVEEMLFRGLLFGRCARMFGIPVGLVISSLIFGVIHGPTKAVPAGIGGAGFALFFSISHNLTLTALMHMGVNMNTATVNNKINPMAPFDEQCKLQAEMAPLTEDLDFYLKPKLQLLQKELYREREPEAIIVEKGDMMEALEDDFKTFKPEMSAAVKRLFHLLDTDQKGYLNVTEFAYLFFAHPRHEFYLQTVNNIIQQRTRDLDTKDADERARLLDGLHRRYPAFQVAPCALPHELLTNSATQSPTPIQQASGKPHSVYHPQHTGAIDTLLHHMPTHAPSLVSPHPPSPVPADSVPLQFFRNWYSLHSLMAYQDFFHGGQLRQQCAASMSEVGPLTLNGCTEEAFEKYLIRLFQWEPMLAAQWLERVVRILKNEEQHPVTHLLSNATSQTGPLAR